MSPSSLFLSALLLILAGALLISPALSQSCTSPKPASRYAHCTELSTLNAALHYTAANSTLSFFFAARPENNSGWVAWGVNPSGTGMFGAFAFLAFKRSGNITVNPYYLTRSITQQKMPWPVANLTAVAESGGVISISATMTDLPKNMSRKLNHLWQVGPLQNQIPRAHSFNQENLDSKATLELSTGKSATPAAAPPSGDGNNRTVPTTPATGQSPTGTDAGGSSTDRKTNSILYALLVSVAGLLVI